MEWQPILSAMRRNPIGASLIAAQMAVTICVLCNAWFISQHRIDQARRDSGVDEQNLFAVHNEWVYTVSDAASRVNVDLAALRAVPGVVDAYATNSYPFTSNGLSQDIGLQANQSHPTATAAVYFGDEHALTTLRVTVVSGRNFNANEVIDHNDNEPSRPSGVLVTKALADKLFPAGNALGGSIFMAPDSAMTRIIGIVTPLQVPWVAGGSAWATTRTYDSMVLPYRFLGQNVNYIVRTAPGQQVYAMQATRAKLAEVSRDRVIAKLQRFSDARSDAYRNTRGLAVVLTAISCLLLLVTGLGIVGITSYWVTQRRKQIGIRRALGATRLDIVMYFQTEGLLIAAVASGVGAVLAVALNLWMVMNFEMDKLPSVYLVLGVIVVLMVGQFATLWPGLRAASLSPAIATREG